MEMNKKILINSIATLAIFAVLLLGLLWIDKGWTWASVLVLFNLETKDD